MKWKWLCTILLATSIVTSGTTAHASTDCDTNEELLKSTLSHFAMKAIQETYKEGRSWYPNRFKIVSVTPGTRRTDRYVVMEISSCTSKNLYVRGVDHEDLVTLYVDRFSGIRVVKVEKVY